MVNSYWGQEVEVLWSFKGSGVVDHSVLDLKFNFNAFQLTAQSGEDRKCVKGQKYFTTQIHPSCSNLCQCCLQRSFRADTEQRQKCVDTIWTHESNFRVWWICDITTNTWTCRNKRPLCVSKRKLELTKTSWWVWHRVWEPPQTLRLEDRRFLWFMLQQTHWMMHKPYPVQSNKNSFFKSF